VRLLFVCTGNTCRSPFAAAVAAREAELLGRDLEVESAGLSAWDGEPATDEAREAARVRGIDLGAHRTRPLTPELVARADVVVAMAREHVSSIEHHGGSGKTRLLGAAGVEDPLGGGPEAYARAYERIEADVRALVRERG
jgi:protein-tyrosine-phosphatase